MYSRAGSIIPDFLPGQIPDSGHVYEVYGVNQIILGWKKPSEREKKRFFAFFCNFSANRIFKCEALLVLGISARRRTYVRTDARTYLLASTLLQIFKDFTLIKDRGFRT